MCLGVPARVLAVDDGAATVSMGSTERTVSLALLDPGSVGAGDWVVVHLGFAMEVLDEDGAREALLLLAAIGEGDAEAVAAARRLTYPDDPPPG